MKIKQTIECFFYILENLRKYISLVLLFPDIADDEDFDVVPKLLRM